MDLNTLLLIIILIILPVTVNLFFNNRSLKREKRKLEEILEIKETTIKNYKASRVAVEDVVKNFSMLDEVISRIDKGKSKSEIAKELNISIEKIDIILKLDKIKNKIEK